MSDDLHVKRLQDTKAFSQLLDEFTSIIHDRDPMSVRSDNLREYEGESLSILSRFVESALHLSVDQEMASEAAKVITQQAFYFWFEEQLPEGFDLDGLVIDLLHCYVSAFPSQQSPDTESQNT